MANTQSTQAFYALTLEQPSAVTAAVACSVIPERKEHQILEARGQRLVLHCIQPDPLDETTKIFAPVAELDVFGIIQSITALRIPGTQTDQIVVSTDSGRIVVLEYDPEHRRFTQIKLETYGKSGIRRAIPGQYLASDPRGRCVMLASTEKNKVVYLLNRSTDGEITISSPKEANVWTNLCFYLTAVDMGWEQPVFAVLEMEYEDLEKDSSGESYAQRQKQLAYYTVDLGLNHVSKSWSQPVDYSANMLFALPGGADGPSGVLVCAADRIYYRHNQGAALTVPIPRRRGATEDPTRKRHIVCGCVHLNRAQKDFFILLQSEDGDTFKLNVIMETDERGHETSNIEEIVIKYYDTFPVARQMLVNKRGFLYIAAENGQSMVYVVDDLAKDPEFEPYNTFTSRGYSPDHDQPYEPAYFQPRKLAFTHLHQIFPGLHPLIKAKVENPLNEDAPQIYALQGTGRRSQFKTIRHGLNVEIVVNNPLGNVPYDNIWTFKRHDTDEMHGYLLVSSNYGDLTVVCSIDEIVEQVENTNFLSTRATVHAGLMGEETLVQVHARGIRSFPESGRPTDWDTPTHRTIVAASANSHQLLIGMSSAELALFLMSDEGVLMVNKDYADVSGKITAIGVAPTPKGRKQAKFAVVGCDDCTVRVYSIEQDRPLENLSVQALTAVPHSIEVVEMLDPTTRTLITVAHIGLESGLYLRASIDELTGDLGDVRSKFLGSRPPRFFPATVNDQESVLACSSRTWLGYNHPQTGFFTTTPLVSSPFSAARSFISPELNGLCAIQGSSLILFQIPSTAGRLAESAIDLSYTPRGMVRHPEYPIWYVVQSDGNTLSGATRNGLRSKAKTDAKANAESNGTMDVDGEKTDTKMEIDTEATGDEPADEATLALEKHLGLPRGDGHWASCVQVLDPIHKKGIYSTIELEANEAALCCTCVAFESKGWEIFLAVGTGQHMSATPTGETRGYVHIYQLLEYGTKLQLVHKTAFKAPVYALTQFRGRLAIGVGKELFIHELGSTALLRKARGVAVANRLVTLEVQGNRLVCGDVSAGLSYVVYKPQHNRMVAFVDDAINRWTTTASMLDYETTAGGDKFGNLWVVRCPPLASREADEEGAGGFIMNERSYLNGAPYRLELRAHYFTQDIPMSIQKTALTTAGDEVLFWAGLQGTLGMLVPFAAREDVEFFTQLELKLQVVEKPMAGRDHLLYRSYYVPVKGVVDGDLCERFLALGVDGKMRVAAELDREVKEVEKKVQEMRSRVAF